MSDTYLKITFELLQRETWVMTH